MSTFSHATFHRRRRQLAIAIIAMLITICGLSPATAQASADSTGTTSSKTYRDKNTLETILNLPLQLVYLPFELVFEGIAYGVEITENGNLYPRVYDFLVSDDGRRALYPTAAPPIGFGLKFFQRDVLTNGSKFSLSATYGMRQRQNYQIKLKHIQIAGNLKADIRARYQLQPDEYFFGVESTFPNGSDVDTDRSNFSQETILGEVKLGLEIDEIFEAKLVGGYEVNSIFGGRNQRYPSISAVYDKRFLQGFQSDLRMMRYELEIHYQHSDRKFRPRKEGRYLLRGGVFQESGADDNRFAFTKVTVDVSHTLHLFYNRVLQLRVAGEFTDPLHSDKLIPFYYLSELGRQETIRGYLRGRFRDRDIVLGSAEYRYPIWDILDVFLFADAGKISHNIFSNFSEEDWRIGYGAGLKLWGINGLVTDAALGISEDGMRFYFGLNREL